MTLRPHSLDDRRAAVLAVMARRGIARLLAFGNGHHMIDLANPIAHLTGFLSVGSAILVLDADGSMCLAVGDREEAERARLRLPATMSIGDDVGRMIVGLKSGGERVATFGLDVMPRGYAHSVGHALGALPLALDDEIFAATAAKTDVEIANAREATRIAEAGFRHMLEIVRPGMPECDLAVAVNLHMRGLGANDSFLMLNCGPRADAVMPSSERPIEPGDLLLCELSPSADGQFVQICRTVSIGAPRPETPEKYGLLVAAMRDGIARVKPGVRMGEVCMAIDDNLSAKGYAKFSRPPFIRRRGHGLGCGSVFPGDVSVDNDTVLEPGMLFMVHPNQFLPETGYMMCGEPVLVTEDGCEVLSQEQAAFAVAYAGGRT